MYFSWIVINFCSFQAGLVNTDPVVEFARYERLIAENRNELERQIASSRSEIAQQRGQIRTLQLKVARQALNWSSEKKSMEYKMRLLKQICEQQQVFSVVLL